MKKAKKETMNTLEDTTEELYYLEGDTRAVYTLFSLSPPPFLSVLNTR